MLRPDPQSDCSWDSAGEEGTKGGQEEPARRGDGRPEARKRALTRDQVVGTFTLTIQGPAL